MLTTPSPDAARSDEDAEWGQDSPIPEAILLLPSTYVWEDDMGTQHEVTQGEERGANKGIL